MCRNLFYGHAPNIENVKLHNENTLGILIMCRKGEYVAAREIGLNAELFLQHGAELLCTPHFGNQRGFRVTETLLQVELAERGCLFWFVDGDKADCSAAYLREVDLDGYALALDCQHT